MPTIVALRRRIPAAALAPCVLDVPGAFAVTQAGYPNRAVRMNVPFPAGGAADCGARSIGQALQARWGQPVVFGNRGGARHRWGLE